MSATQKDTHRSVIVNELDAVTSSRRVDGALHVAALDDGYGTSVGKLMLVVDGKDKVATVQQVQWFLEHDAWEDDVESSCGVPHCISHLKRSSVQITEEDLLKLVERNSVSLADLYRKGRQKGLISARSSGY